MSPEAPILIVGAGLAGAKGVGAAPSGGGRGAAGSEGGGAAGAPPPATGFVHVVSLVFLLK